MRLFFFIVIRLINKTKVVIISFIKKSYFSFRNPSCKIDETSIVNDCTFDKYVVIFGNCIIYNSNIGLYSYIQNGGRISNCDIGKFCSIAGSVSIAPGIHSTVMVSTHPSLYQKSTPLPLVFAKHDDIIPNKRVIIENDVWIGEKVVILDGIKIGNGAIVASGSIVTKDVEPYSIVGGVPAKHIKYRFDTETINIFLKSKWWNYPENWFLKNSQLLLNPDVFKKYLLNKN